MTALASDPGHPYPLTRADIEYLTTYALYGKGNRVACKRGKNIGCFGVVFWLAPNKYGSGFIVGYKDGEDGTAYFNSPNDLDAIPDNDGPVVTIARSIRVEGHQKPAGPPEAQERPPVATDQQIADVWGDFQ